MDVGRTKVGNIIRDTDAFRGGDEDELTALPVPIMERDTLSISDFHQCDETLSAMSECSKIEMSQFLYCTGELAKSCDISKTLLDSQNRSVALSARTTHMIASVALGDSRSAFDDLQIIKTECDEGFACAASDPILFRTSIFCALLAEDILSSRIFEFPEISNGIDGLPLGLKAYFGFLQALRMIRKGEASMALGVVSVSQALLGNRKPIPKAFLHLAAASAYMAIGKTNEALGEYVTARDILQSIGAIFPFVEMNFSLLGMSRHYCGMHSSTEYKRIETMALLYHEGWAGLRRLCGLSDTLASLSPVAANVASLAFLGWRNKEIASHLHISENTVKHQLSESYQRLQVKSRSELRSIFDGGL